MDDLTKRYLDQLIGGLRGEMNGLRGELRNDLNAVEQKLSAQIGHLARRVDEIDDTLTEKINNLSGRVDRNHATQMKAFQEVVEKARAFGEAAATDARVTVLEAILAQMIARLDKLDPPHSKH